MIEKVSKEQIKARYLAGTMGYRSCVVYLVLEYGMTVLEAAEHLCGEIKRKEG